MKPGRPRLPRCALHTTASRSTCSRCLACRTLRGTGIPAPHRSGPSGTSGAERKRRTKATNADAEKKVTGIC